MYNLLLENLVFKVGKVRLTQDLKINLLSRALLLLFLVKCQKYYKVYVLQCLVSGICTWHCQSVQRNKDQAVILIRF